MSSLSFSPVITFVAMSVNSTSVSPLAAGVQLPVSILHMMVVYCDTGASVKSSVVIVHIQWIVTGYR